jgi:hypothetical protein
MGSSMDGIEVESAADASNRWKQIISAGGEFDSQ